MHGYHALCAKLETAKAALSRLSNGDYGYSLLARNIEELNRQIMAELDKDEDAREGRFIASYPRWNSLR